MNNELIIALKSRPWSMEPRALKGLAEQMASLDVSGILTSVAVARQPKELKIADGVAIINVSGVLLKSVPGWLRLWGLNATGYDEIREQVSAALASKAVSSIHLVIDSPGGIIDDVEKTADALYQARQQKPLTATINNRGASCAYWIASQAETIDADELNTQVGAIGVYTVYADWTKLDEKMGLKVVVIRSGEHKGMGIDGITENQIAAVQENIDTIADNFINAVARGRGKEAGSIRELATGQLWMATKARELGLIDSVTVQANQTSQSDIKGEVIMKTEEETKTEQADQIAKATAKATAEGKEAAMNEERQRISAINEKFGEDPEFAFKAVAEGWTMAEAHEAYNDVLRGKLKDKNNSQSQIDNSQSEGFDSNKIPAEESNESGAGGDFMAEARELAETKKISVTAAMQKLRRQKPALHKAFLSRCETSGKAMYAEAG